MTSPEAGEAGNQKKSTGTSWTSFWPGLASNFVSIVIGVPIALGLAHYGLSIQEGARQAEEQARLQRGLRSLATVVRQNAARLGSLSESLRKNEIPYDVGLDISAWDVSKQEVIPFLRDADLQRRVAHHFTQAEAMRRLAALLLDQYVGVASALGNAPQTRQALRDRLQADSKSLSQEAGRLADDIERVAKQ